MRRVGHVAAIHLAGRDDVDRRLLVLHHVHLHTGGLRAQEHVGLAAHRRRLTRKIAYVERVLHRAGRMVLRGVQRLEVVVIGLNLGAVDNRVAQAEEDFRHFVGDRVDQMTRAHLLRAAGERDVDGACVDRGFHLGCCELLLARFKRLFHHVAHLVDRLADDGALFLRDLAHAAQVARKRARLAEHRHAHALERRRRVGFRDARKGLLTQLRELVRDRHNHLHLSYRAPHLAQRALRQ